MEPKYEIVNDTSTKEEKMESLVEQYVLKLTSLKKEKQEFQAIKNKVLQALNWDGKNHLLDKEFLAADKQTYRLDILITQVEEFLSDLGLRQIFD